MLAPMTDLSTGLLTLEWIRYYALKRIFANPLFLGVEATGWVGLGITDLPASHRFGKGPIEEDYMYKSAL